MTNSSQRRTWVRIVNGLVAVAFAAFVLVQYWPLVRLFDLSRADLGYQGAWIEGYAKRVTSVTPGGAADRAGIKPGNVLQFDPSRNDDWILASYRNMPDGFTGTLPVRHADGAQSTVRLAPARVGYLPTLNDRLGLLARLTGLTVGLLMGVLLVWARPCLMTWSFFLSACGSVPHRVLVDYLAAFPATALVDQLSSRVADASFALFFFMVPLALSFPRDTVPGWRRWQRALLVVAIFAVVMVFALAPPAVPFKQDTWPGMVVVWAPMAILTGVVGLVAMLRTYRDSEAEHRARLKWAMLGWCVMYGAFFVTVPIIVLAQVVPHWRTGNPLTPVHWLVSITQGLLLPLTMAYAILRARVLDVQFAVSRTVVYGIVSTIVLVFLAVLHWLLGRIIEHSRLAFGLEGLAAVGLGLVLHRTSHSINGLVDRVLFRKHHAAEERLRQVATALPYATTERSIAEALVNEPAHNLDLTSAALFYRASEEGPLTRVLSHGWSDDHVMSLDAEGMLVRYLQAEHDPLHLEDVQWLPSGMPEGIAHPVLAIPIVNQHALTAVVLYGGHVNGTLLDPDEIELLSALAKAAATSHQQVRIATLTRQAETQRSRINELEASTAELRELVRQRLTSVGESK